MNWLERARCEIREMSVCATADTAERPPTAVLAVPGPALGGEARASIGSNGSTSADRCAETASLTDEFEERAAIMEFDGGLSRDEAERAAWALVSTRRQLH